MKKNLLKNWLTMLIIMTLSLTSCVEEIKLDDENSDISLNPAIALPIGSVHAYMVDLLNFVDSSFINVDENNGIYVYFEQEGINVNFELDQFSKGEKLEETLTLSRIKEVSTAFKTIDQYINDFNHKIESINRFIQTGKIEELEPVQYPEGIVLGEEYIAQIDQINDKIEIINQHKGQDINQLPNSTREEIIEILEEVKAIGKIEEFKEVVLPETKFDFTQPSEYDFGFTEYVEGEKSIRIDSILITDANVDFEIDIEGVDFTDGSYMLLQLDFPQLFEESIQNKFETITITENNFMFREKFHEVIARLEEVNQSNKTNLSVTFTLVSAGGLTISRDAKIHFSTEVNLINFEKIYGHIWQKDEFQKGEIAFDIPEGLFTSELISKNNILLSNPQIAINFNHNVGIPMKLRLDNFYYEKNGERFNLDNQDANHNIEIGIKKPTMNEMSTENFKLDNTNSPIAELIQKFPDRIGVAWHVLTPKTEENDAHFFVNPVIANMDIDVTVPFQFDANTHFTYSDTIAADLKDLLQSVTDVVNIDTLCLYLDVTSGLPASVIAKLYYLDENNNVLYESSKFEITSAEVDGEGRVKEPTIQNKAIGFSSNLAKEIMETKNIVFEIGLKSKDDMSKIYIQSTDKIDLTLSAYAKANINITNNSKE